MNAAAAAKKRSISEEAAAEPPAKRLNRDTAVARPSWSDLTPDLIGHIARFVPMGTPNTPNMMRLLLCVGPRVAAVVRKLYLTGNEYYLSFCFVKYVRMGRNDRAKESLKGRAKECIGYWMDYNEKAWKKRCLGKTHKSNTHAVMLTPEQFRSFVFGRLDGLTLVKPGHSTLSEASLSALHKVSKNSKMLFLISVGDKDVDDGRLMTEEECDSLINSAPFNSDGKISLQFMRGNDAIFAYPQFYLNYDLVHVLRFQIEENIIEPRVTIISVDDHHDRQSRSLLYLAVKNDSDNCFRYLLSLPGTDINAAAYCRQTHDGETYYYENIIHVCLISDEIPPSHLKDILAHSKLSLNARNHFGETALCLGCGPELDDFGDHTIPKLRLLLEAGADPRVEDDDGGSPLSNINVLISNMEASEDLNDDLKNLMLLRKEIAERILELNNIDDQNT